MKIGRNPTALHRITLVEDQAACLDMSFCPGLMDSKHFSMTLQGHSGGWGVVHQPDRRAFCPKSSWPVPISSSVLTLPHLIFGCIYLSPLLLCQKCSILHFQSSYFCGAKPHRFPSGESVLFHHLFLVGPFPLCNY